LSFLITLVSKQALARKFISLIQKLAGLKKLGGWQDPILPAASSQSEINFFL